MAAPLSLKAVRQRLLLLPCILLITLCGIGSAETISEYSSGLTLTVSEAGWYAVQSLDPPFRFGGDVGSPLSNLVVGEGTDNLGQYRQFTFRYSSNGERFAGIRIYADKPIVLFSVTYLEGAPNTARFPDLTDYPRQPFHMTFEDIFGRYRFDRFAKDSPWVFFDARANTFILSPASNFSAATTVMGKSQDIQSGINPDIATLPQGFKHDTILVIEKGVNKAFDTWGRALTRMYGKTRPANDADVVLDRLGYWTDAGARYWYQFEPNLSYAETLQRVKQEYEQRGAPLGYMQLDSWFYPKGANAQWTDFEGGIYRYEADATLFPQGLKSFQEALGIPLLAHARWIDASSPYRREYRMSNNVVTDPLYWERVADYLDKSGAVGYEQDWLGAKAQASLNLNDAREFFGNMASAYQNRRMNIQYCMPLPAHFMQSVRYDNVTTIRVSNDQFLRNKWDEFLFASRFASALGLWPWSDAVRSPETDNLLLSTLSAGPVGVGDRIGEVDGKSLLRAVRADGVIVKPDESIVPLDESFINDAQGLDKPMVGFTYTDFEQSRALYVFAYRRGEDSNVSFTPATMGLNGRVYVYNYFTRAGMEADADAPYRDSMQADRAYYIIVPIGPSGVGFLGDAGHFVTLGKKRIVQLKDSGTLQTAVVFAKGETSRTVFGYSPSGLAVVATRGVVSLSEYDENTHLFRLTLTPDGVGVALITIRQL